MWSFFVDWSSTWNQLPLTSEENSSFYKLLHILSLWGVRVLQSIQLDINSAMGLFSDANNGSNDCSLWPLYELY